MASLSLLDLVCRITATKTNTSIEAEYCNLMTVTKKELRKPVIHYTVLLGMAKQIGNKSMQKQYQNQLRSFQMAYEDKKKGKIMMSDVVFVVLLAVLMISASDYYWF